MLGVYSYRPHSSTKHQRIVADAIGRPPSESRGGTSLDRRESDKAATQQRDLDERNSELESPNALLRSSHAASGSIRRTHGRERAPRAQPPGSVHRDRRREVEQPCGWTPQARSVGLLPDFLPAPFLEHPMPPSARDLDVRLATDEGPSRGPTSDRDREYRWCHATGSRLADVRSLGPHDGFACLEGSRTTRVSTRSAVDGSGSVAGAVEP